MININIPEKFDLLFSLKIMNILIIKMAGLVKGKNIDVKKVTFAVPDPQIMDLDLLCKL